MIAIRITGIGHHNSAQIADCIVPKNVCYIKAEENPHASDGIAYACHCKGLLIGYVPELATLRRYLADAKSDAERARITEWGRAVNACRVQFQLDADVPITQWTARVCGLLYSKDEAWIEYQEYSDLCQKNQHEGWTLRQISVMVEGVEEF